MPTRLSQPPKLCDFTTVNGIKEGLTSGAREGLFESKGHHKLRTYLHFRFYFSGDVAEKSEPYILQLHSFSQREEVHVGVCWPL